MIQHGVKRVKSIESDVTKFDFSAIAPIAFCLLDVDLYRPIKDVLPKIYGAMSPGGIATKQLAQLAARKAAKAAEAAAPAVVKPKHAPAPAPPTKTPEQLRDRVRAALLRRRA